MLTAGYDFLTWKSLPSSLKLINDEKGKYAWGGSFTNIPVIPGRTLKSTVQIKQENVIDGYSHLSVYYYNDVEWKFLGELAHCPIGTFDWTMFTKEIIVPADAKIIKGACAGGAGNLGITWFDDLLIYQDGALIYENYFTALRPGKIIPTVIKPPEVIVSAVQRWKAGRVREEILRRPLAIASI